MTRLVKLFVCCIFLFSTIGWSMFTSAIMKHASPRGARVLTIDRKWRIEDELNSFKNLDRKSFARIRKQFFAIKKLNEAWRRKGSDRFLSFQAERLLSSEDVSFPLLRPHVQLMKLQAKIFLRGGYDIFENHNLGEFTRPLPTDRVKWRKFTVDASTLLMENTPYEKTWLLIAEYASYISWQDSKEVVNQMHRMVKGKDFIIVPEWGGYDFEQITNFAPFPVGIIGNTYKPFNNFDGITHALPAQALYYAIGTANTLALFRDRFSPITAKSLSAQEIDGENMERSAKLSRMIRAHFMANHSYQSQRIVEAILAVFFREPSFLTNPTLGELSHRTGELVARPSRNFCISVLRYLVKDMTYRSIADPDDMNTAWAEDVAIIDSHIRLLHEYLEDTQMRRKPAAREE